MAEVGALEWAAELKGAADAKESAHEMADGFEGAASSAREADDAVDQVGDSADSTTGSFRGVGVQSGFLSGTLLLLGSQIFTLIAQFTGLATASAALSGAFGGLVTLGSKIAGFFGTIVALGKGFVAWMAAGSAGALALAGAIGAFIGILAVMVLEVTGVLDAVSRLGKWMRDLLPQWVRDGIVAVMAAIGGWFLALGAAITGFVEGFLRGGLEEGWNQAIENVKEMLSIFVGSFSRTWERIKSLGANFIKWIKKWVDKIVGGLTDAWDNGLQATKNFGNNVISTIKNFFGGIGQSGRELVDNFVQGIKDKASAPVDAVKDMAGNVRDHLPFSPAETGPLSDLDKVGPGFINQIAGDIEGNKKEVTSSVEGMAGDMSSGMSMENAATNSGSSGSDSSGGDETIIIEQQTIEIGDQSIDLRNLGRRQLERLADMITQKQGEELKKLIGA